MEQTIKQDGNINFTQSVIEINELQNFVHELAHQPDISRVKNGEDLLLYAKNLKLKIPAFLDDASFTCTCSCGTQDVEKAPGAKTIVLVIPKKTEKAFTGHYHLCGIVRKGEKVLSVCIDCGWLWCTISVEVLTLA